MGQAHAAKANAMRPALCRSKTIAERHGKQLIHVLIIPVAHQSPGAVLRVIGPGGILGIHRRREKARTKTKGTKLAG